MNTTRYSFKRAFLAGFISIFIMTGTNAVYAKSTPKNEDFHTMQERVKRVKESVVRILVNEQPAGSGFVISSDGKVATCFHVVQNLTQGPNNQVTFGFSSNIGVEFSDGSRVKASPVFEQKDLVRYISRDFAILETNKTKLTPLKLGSFSEVSEGDAIYTAGFPLGINQVIVAQGILSTKWKTEGYAGQKGLRDVAWLDITMNKGNSGGPVIQLGEIPDDDKVIGIATFILNPFSVPSRQLVSAVQQFPGKVGLMGIDFRQFSTFIGEAFMTVSLGVGGAVSVDYLVQERGE